MWQTNADRGKIQSRLLLALAVILRQRNAALSELQQPEEEGGAREAAAAPTEAPWTRQQVHAQHHFRHPGALFDWKAAGKSFPGGEEQLRRIAAYAAALK